MGGYGSRGLGPRLGAGTPYGAGSQAGSQDPMGVVAGAWVPDTGPCPEQRLTFRLVSGAANVIGPKICLEDEMLMSHVKNNVGRGLNMALVNGEGGRGNIVVGHWAGQRVWGDVNELLKFIRMLHEGTLVFVASYDDPATKWVQGSAPRMNKETWRIFSELGSSVAKELGFRDSWVFMEVKGVQDKSPFEQVGPPPSRFPLPGGQAHCAPHPQLIAFPRADLGPASWCPVIPAEILMSGGLGEGGMGHSFGWGKRVGPLGLRGWRSWGGQ
uniref:ILEI/PANDER domain-containing protein n=1 Tax=Gopherus evgoodei TaxID=1825980 RepID=A0A8C4WIA9_9SAUR